MEQRGKREQAARKHSAQRMRSSSGKDAVTTAFIITIVTVNASSPSSVAASRRPPSVETADGRKEFFPWDILPVCSATRCSDEFTRAQEP
jgi:hypothetical protein